MAMPPYFRRYSYRMLGFGAAYAGAFVGAVMLMTSAAPPKGAIAYLVATVPALLVIGMIWSIFQLLQDTEDEYQKLLLAKGLLLAAGITLALATLWGFLEAFDLVPHIDLYWVVCVWFPMTGLAGWMVRRRA
jgi:hypothetical protein